MKTNATACERVWRLPKSPRGRVVFGLTTFLVVLLLVPGWIAFSLWIEKRFPSSDPKRALLPTAQRVVTKPVVTALGRQAERYVRSRLEEPHMYSWLTREQLIALFLDERIDLKQRRRFAYRLAHDGSPECMAALQKVLQTASPVHKAVIVQLIGSTGNPAAKSVLWLLLEDPNEQVVLATVRGLSVIGGDDVTSRIAGILNDNQRAEQIRIEAALALGTIGTEESGAALVKAFGEVPSDELATQILKSLGRFKFSAVGDVFKQYLDAPDTPSEMRVTAAEALANSSNEAVPFLLGLAAKDADADVRAAAAWAISVHPRVDDLGPALANLATRETGADVRRRLYEALLSQAGIPAEQLLPIVQAEIDIAARVAGFNAVGRVAHQQPASAVAVAFDQEIVPELVQIATTPNSLNIQMRAVFALRRARTATAQAALASIANSAGPQVAAAARNGL